MQCINILKQGTKKSQIVVSYKFILFPKVRRGNIPRQWFPYLALEIQGHVDWEELGKTLDLSHAVLNGIEIDINEEYERIYKMLKTWWQKGAASFDKLAFALRKHKLEVIRRDFCLMRHTPPLKEDVKLRE